MYHYNYASQPNEISSSNHYNVRADEPTTKTWEPQLNGEKNSSNSVWSSHKFPAESQRSALANYIKPQDVPERNFTNPPYQMLQSNGTRVFPNNSLVQGGSHVMHHNGSDGPNRVPPTIYFPRILLNSSESQIKAELENSQQLPEPNVYHQPPVHGTPYQINVNTHQLNGQRIDIEKGSNGLIVQSDPSYDTVGSSGTHEKKEDKWGPLLKAGKKVTNIKSIFVKKSAPPTPEPKPKIDLNGYIPKKENSLTGVGSLKVSNSSSIDAQLNRDPNTAVVYSQANERGGLQYSSMKSWNETSLSRKQRCNSLQQVNDGIINANRVPLYEQSTSDNQSRISATLGHGIDPSKVNEMFQDMERHNSCEAFTDRFGRLSKSIGNLETQTEFKDSRTDIENACNANNPNQGFSTRQIPMFEGRPPPFQGGNVYHSHHNAAQELNHNHQMQESKHLNQAAERMQQSSQLHVSSHHLSITADDSEWIDITDAETAPCMYGNRSIRSNKNADREIPNQSRDCGTPPLPPLFPEGSPTPGLRKHSHSFSASSAPNRPDLLETSANLHQKQNSSNQRKNQIVAPGSFYNANESGSLSPPASTRWHRNTCGKHDKNGKSHGESKLLASIPPKPSPSSRLDEASTDAAIDLTSVNGGMTEATSDDDDMSSVDDRNSYLLRRQLQGLEGMYSEVLKLLGNRSVSRHPDARMLRRRLHGSMSSLQSSVVSGRPFVPIRRIDARSGRVNNDRDKRGSKESTKIVDKRFQRLESHVVTLARSVAHLSSEMRTQHLMFQEIESLREELSSLRVEISGGTKGGVHTPNRGSGLFGGDFMHTQNGIPNPLRVKKLTQFFGDEPPLVRFFLRGLGYEKYANIFEKEKIGMLELPYMTEERLLKIGIPLGPRLRILQEAQGPIKTEGNLSVYVV